MMGTEVMPRTGTSMWTTKTSDMSSSLPSTREDRVTALRMAIKEGNVERLRFLLRQPDSDQDVISRVVDENGDRQTFLHLAIMEGRAHSAEIVGELIEHATNHDGYVNTKNYLNETALHYASMWKNVPENSQIVKQLLDAAKDKNAYVTATGVYGRTALHYASRYGNPQALQQLIDAVTNKDQYVTATDNDGRTALHYASEHGRGQVIEQLFNVAKDKNGYVTATDNDGYTALHYASEGKSDWAVKLLIDAATNKNEYVTATDEDGYTALHHITERTNPNIVDLLIDQATNKNLYLSKKDPEEGKTSFHIAAKMNNPKVTERLVKKATDMNMDAFLAIKDASNDTALHTAVSANSTDVVKALLDGTTDAQYCINLPGNHGRTPLHQAAYFNYCGSALLLLLKGADPALKDADGKTAWNLAYTPGAEQYEVLVTLILTEKNFKLGLPQLSHSYMKTNSMFNIYMIISYLAYHLTIDPASPRMIRGPTDYITVKGIETMAAIVRQIRQEFQENQDAPPHLRTREPSCISQILDLSRPINTTLDFVSLVIPFLYIGNWSITEAREEKHKDLTRELVNCVSNDDIPVEGFFETHTPITLDEYSNPALPQRILALRNKDQVLGRYEKSTLENNDPNDPTREPNVKDNPGLLGELWELARFYTRKLLYLKNPESQENLNPEHLPATNNTPTKIVMVSQAWVWKIGPHIITPDPKMAGLDLPGDHWDDLHAIDPIVFITLLLGKIVERFDAPGQGGNGLLLRTYENALVIISEEVNQYTKDALVEDIDLDQEKSLFHQINDLREELSMIKSVLSEQEDVWNEWMNVARPNGGAYQPRHSKLKNPSQKKFIEFIGLEGTEDEIIAGQDRRTRAKFSKYNRRITKIEEDAERVEHNISTKLELKQKHATIKEAHSTAILSATIFGFTIITVIFAPLSFIVALFALPIDQFKEGKYGDDDVFSSSYIGKWVATTEFVSIAITLTSMWAALRFADLHIWGKKGLRESIRRKAGELRTIERDRKVAGDMGAKYNSRGSNRRPDLEQGIGTAKSPTNAS